MDYGHPLHLGTFITPTNAAPDVPVGLASVKGKGTSPWEIIAAVMLITSVPVIAIFTAFQRQFIEGLVRGSLKG